MDVKLARDGTTHCLVLSESRRAEGEGAPYQKSRIFVYPEDLDRFSRGVHDATQKIKQAMPGYDFSRFDKDRRVSDTSR